MKNYIQTNYYKQKFKVKSFLVGASLQKNSFVAMSSRHWIVFCIIFYLVPIYLTVDDAIVLLCAVLTSK